MNLRRYITNASVLWNIVFGLTLLVYIVGLLVTIMELDAAVYAEVSMEMYTSGNYFEIFRKGADWLDKPHFPFWITALSYKLFGINNFSYKFPAVIFILIAALYTYLFTARYYSKRHAFIAVLLLLSAQHTITSNNDVRAEPYLTGLTIFSLYCFAVYLDLKKILYLLAGCAGLACLIMTKGLFTIIPVAAGIGFSLLYKLKWREIFHWQWLLCLALTTIFLFPSLYAYYTQFDLHPEKEIFGRTNVSGVKFFLWDSQWGRFASTGPIVGKGDPFYFVHTLLWAFAPWAFLAFYALFQKTKNLIKKNALPENYTYFGFISLFLIFSASRFQLSFYLNPLFPLLAILTSVSILNLEKNRKALKVFTVIQIVLCLLLVIALCGLHYFFFDKSPRIDTLLIVIIGLAIAFYLFTRKGLWIKKIVFGSALVILSINYYLNRDFYPALLKYQPESELAKYLKENNVSANQLVYVEDEVFVTDVLMHQLIPELKVDQLHKENLKNKFIFTNEEGLKKMRNSGIQIKLVREFYDFPITTLTGRFINKKTRMQTLGKKYLLRVISPDGGAH